MVLKPVVKKSNRLTTSKKPQLKKVKKSFPLTPGKITNNLSCEWRNNFPFQPVMREYEAIYTEEQLEWLSDQLMIIPAFAYDTETNTLRVLSNNEEFKFVGISFSWGEDNN